MTTVSSVTSTTSTASSSSVDTTAQPVISSDFETFLQMLSTQLQNQDPLDPVKSEDFAVQLATFSSVEQQVLTNNLLESLIAQNTSAAMSDLADWVGLEALSLAPGNWQGDPISVSPNPLTAADTTIFVVRNSDDTVVYEAEVPVSAEAITWDGTNTAGVVQPYGNYTFELENYAEGELLATDQLESYALITEARLVNGETVLVTAAGDLIPSDMITGLRQPGG